MKEMLRKNVLLIVFALRASAGLVGVIGILFYSVTLTVQTGNITNSVISLFQGEFESWRVYVTAIVSFVLGGLLSAVIFEDRSFVPQRRYYHIFSLVALWFVIAGIYDFPRAVNILMLGTLLGFQNALNVYYDGMRIKSTILSGTLTDIGRDIGLILRGHKKQARRLKFNLFNVFGFLVGVTIGAILFFYTNAEMLAIVAVDQLVIAGLFYAFYRNYNIAVNSGTITELKEIYE